MISKKTYDKMKKGFDEASKNNDYARMLFTSHPSYNDMKEYEQEKVCKHTSIEEIQGGQIEKCRHCGKTWG